MQLPDEGEQRMIAWLPGDEATADALRNLADEPSAVPTSPAGTPHLRVVREA